MKKERRTKWKRRTGRFEIHFPTRFRQIPLNPSKSQLKNKSIFTPPPLTPAKFSQIRVHPCPSVIKPPVKNKNYQTNPFVIYRSVREFSGLSPLSQPNREKRTHFRNEDLFSAFRVPRHAAPEHGVGETAFIGCSGFPSRAPRYLPRCPLSNPPEYRIGIPCRCVRTAGLSLSFESSQELLKKQFDRIGNRMDHLMIVMAAGKTLVVSSDARGNEVVGCKKLVTRTGVQQPATKPKRQQLYFTHATPLEK